MGSMLLGVGATNTGIYVGVAAVALIGLIVLAVFFKKHK